QDARENLEGRGLAGAVRPDERDALTRLDAERDPVDGTHRASARRKGVGDARAKPLPAGNTGAERLAQFVDVDCCGHGRLRLRIRAAVRVPPPENQNAFPGDPERRGERVPDRSYADDCSTATKIVSSADWQICVDGRYAWIIVLA